MNLLNRINKYGITIVNIFFHFIISSISFDVYSSPSGITFQSRIAKPDGTVLEASSVSFRFSITDTVGSCVIYQEDFNNRNMSGSKGLINLTLGSGTKAFPVAAMTLAEVFNNYGSPTLNCQSGGNITAGVSDRRKLIVQFNDGSGWQTVPAMDINSTPYAFESSMSHKLGDFPAADYLRTAQFPNCVGGEALHFNGASFTCVSVGSGSGSVTNVTSANNDITITNSTSTPQLTLNVGTGADQIVKLNSSAELPALSAVNLTALNATALASGTVPAGRMPALTGDVTTTAGSVASQITANVIVDADINTSAGINRSKVAAGTPNQILVNDGISGFMSSIGCGNGQILKWSAGVPTCSTDATGVGDIANGGNSTGSTVTIGTNDAQNLVLETNNVSAVTITSAGSVGIGTTNPSEKLEVNGAIKLGSTAGSAAGTIRWDGSTFQGYDGSSWTNFVPNPASSGACDVTNTFSVPGSYSYTVPASFGTITIRLWGGGGSGAATHAWNGTYSDGLTGSASTISSLALSAGGGGAGLGSGVSGAGGPASGGSINTPGNAAPSIGGSWGAGASAPFGGTGGSANGSSGGVPGAGGAGKAGGGSASGGGSGGYVEKVFTTATLIPGTTLTSIIVGAGAASVTWDGNVSGAGGSGRITITCASAGAPVANDRSLIFINGSNYATDTNLVYTASGNVGVGTASPTTKLDVNGGIRPGAATVVTAACAAPVEGTMRYNYTSHYMEYCDGTQWIAIPKSQSAVPPSVPAGTGFFVLTASTWNGNLGGLAGADSKCLTELTANTDWYGHATALANGQLTASKVKAFLCNSATCGNVVPLATYYYAKVGAPGTGGASFTADASGNGPNDTVSWAAANRFGGTHSYWSNHGSGNGCNGSNWGLVAGYPCNGSAPPNCANWGSSSSASSGQLGDSGTNGHARYNNNGSDACDQSYRLLCMVDP